MTAVPEVGARASAPGEGGSGRLRSPVASRWVIGLVLVTLLGVAAVVYRLENAPVLTESFDGPDGLFVSKSQFFGDTANRGRAANPEWFAEDGALTRLSGQGHTDDGQFRMWTWRTDLTDARVSLRLTFHGLVGGSADWRGMNLWLNRTLCTPVPGCSAVDDPEGNSGYALRFVAADGYMIVNKKVAGDTREEFPQRATEFVQGGTYYWLDKAPWRPIAGRTYTLEGRVWHDGDGDAVIELLVDGETRLRVVDDGSIGGPSLSGGRIGVRSDYADMTIDDLQVFV